MKTTKENIQMTRLAIMKPSAFVLRSTDNALVWVNEPVKPTLIEMEGKDDRHYSDTWVKYRSSLKQAIADGVRVADESMIVAKIWNTIKGDPHEATWEALKPDTIYHLDVEMEVRETPSNRDGKLLAYLKPKTETKTGDGVSRTDTVMEKFEINNEGFKGYAEVPPGGAILGTTDVPQSRRSGPLGAPSAYSLQDCLAELKFGRPAAQQIWLDEKINELNNAE